MRTITLIAFLVTGIFFSVSAQTNDTWQKIENDSFSFSVPPPFKKIAVHGIDSFVEEYVADGIELDLDYGMYSDDFGDWPKETKFENLKIDGKAAKIGTTSHEFRKGFQYATQVHIELDGGVKLSMFVACKSENDVALAKEVFKTIRFKSKKA